MTDKEDEETLTEEQFADYLSKAFGFCLVVAFCTLGAYCYEFVVRGPSNNHEKWAHFGSFLGGVLGPVVGLLTAFLVLVSVSIQRKELKTLVQQMTATNASTTQMSFEQSLFAWLANYQLLLKQVDDDEGRIGRAALVYWYEQRFSGESAWKRSSSAMAELSALGATQPGEGFSLLLREPEKPEHRKVLDLVFQQAQVAFDEVWRKHRVGLDPMLRTLSRLFRWIDTSSLSPAQKWHYVSLVSGQLSWIEQVYLLHYILGAAPPWFGTVANTYSLLHGVNTQDPLIVLIAEELTQRKPSSFVGALPASKSWPLRASAFDPGIARQELGLVRECI